MCLYISFSVFASRPSNPRHQTDDLASQYTNTRIYTLITSPYHHSPACILEKVVTDPTLGEAYCAGFEFSEWRCNDLADNLIEWIIDYALKSDELKTLDHTNSYVRLKQAAVRVYTSPKYERRGEVGEIAAHMICRKYFHTIPVAPRVCYLSASNDPVKAFDLVHVRYKDNDEIQLWLGEAKFYQDRDDAIKEAINSISTHIEQGFLKNEKLLLGPQVSNNLPHSHKIKALLSSETSLDQLIDQAVFPVLIAANSHATSTHHKITEEYTSCIKNELSALSKKLHDSNLTDKIKLLLLYVPLGCKKKLNTAFDARLKGLQLGES